MPRLTWSIDVGHILTILVTLVTLGIGYGKVSADLTYLKDEVARLRRVEIQVAHLEQELIDRTGGRYRRTGGN